MALKHFENQSRRLGWALILILVGYPQLIIAVPLVAGLLVQMVCGWFRPEQPHGWRPSDLVGTVGLTVGLVLFLVMATLHLAAAAYVGWKDDGHAEQRPSSDGRRLRFDCTVSTARLKDRIDALARTHTLYGPVSRDEPQCHPPRRYFYERVERAGQLALDFNYCVYGPKSVLLPPHECLLVFDTKSGRFLSKATTDSQPMALVGVHPCDVRAIGLLDAVFSREPRDEHYLARRRNLFLVGIDCAQPCTKGVFCRDQESNHVDRGFDVMLYPLERSTGARGSPGNAPVLAEPGSSIETFGVVYGTQAGRSWLEDAAGTESHQPTDLIDADAYMDRKDRAFERQLGIERERIPELLEHSYDSRVWEETAKRCYSCGSCNLACPTCYCFDICDENDLQPGAGQRERCWDSCMLRDFALVAGDHNFRPAPAQRLRHRVFRKGAWIERRSGITGCVGCARCDRACTAQISIVELINRLAEEVDHASN